MLRIGAFSELTHTSIKTLRFYDARGLLRPLHVDRASGYRYYAADQIGDLQLIQRLKSLGFSLAEISDTLTDRTDADRLRARLLEKRDALATQAREARERMADITGWLEQIRGRDGFSPATVTLKRIGPHAIASIRASIRRYSDATELFQELRHSLKQRDDSSAVRSAIWHTCGDSGGPIDCEVFAIARCPLRTTARVRVCQHPETMMACLVHQGDIGHTANPYVAVRSWVTANGYEIVGSKRELYWRGGLDENRPSDVTEIQFPVRFGRSQSMSAFATR